ncbi:MAG TPA: hypothetical protein VEC75_06700, partial [Stellaceae bacterium]|nr:hypothetical protein [Stellaceae bacterium]
MTKLGLALAAVLSFAALLQGEAHDPSLVQTSGEKPSEATSIAAAIAGAVRKMLGTAIGRAREPSANRSAAPQPTLASPWR